MLRAPFADVLVLVLVGTANIATLRHPPDAPTLAGPSVTNRSRMAYAGSASWVHP